MFASLRFKYDNASPTTKQVVKVVAGGVLFSSILRITQAFIASRGGGQGGAGLVSGLIDLLSMPVRWALSIVGDMLGAVGLKSLERVTDHLIDDWDSDGRKEGIGGEVAGILGFT